MLKFVIVMPTNMSRICLTISLLLIVLTSDAQKNTFKAFGSDWRVFGVSTKIGPANNRESYKLNYRDLNSVVASEDYELGNLNRFMDSGYASNYFRPGGTLWSIHFVVKPIAMSNRKFFSLQEFHLGISQISEYTSKDYSWTTELSPQRFRLNEAQLDHEYRTTYIDPKWIIRTPDLGPSLVFYTGLGARVGIGGYSEIKENYYHMEFAETGNGYYEQVTSLAHEQAYHNLKPNNTYMFYVPLGLKKYISCRFNFVAEYYYGRGTTKIQDSGNWYFESSGFSLGLQYKFQKPIKLDGDEEGEGGPQKGGVFW